MPRLSQFNELYLRNDFISAIHTAQGAADLLQKKELSQASDIPYSTLRKRLDSPEDISIGEIRKLVAAIPLDPEALLRFAGYSQKEINKLKKGV